MHPKSLKFRFPTMSTNILMYSPHTFLLAPEVPPVISSDTREYLAPVDSSVTLRCQADGSPPPSVTWHKDGRVLSETVRLRVLSSGSLQIAFIQPSDAGRYTCTAANAAGTVSWEMSLTVQSRFPSIQSLKWRDLTHHTTFVEFSIKIDGWCMDGSSSSASSQHHSDFILTSRHTVPIKSLKSYFAWLDFSKVPMRASTCKKKKRKWACNLFKTARKLKEAVLQPCLKV